MKKRKIVVSLLILAILVSIAGIWWFMPTKIMSSDIDEVSYIKIGNGNNGTQFVVTDINSINSIIQMLQSTDVRKKEFNSGRSGFSYTIDFYSADDSLYKHFTFMSEKRIVIGSFLYYVQNDTIDFNLLKQLELDLAE